MVKTKYIIAGVFGLSFILLYNAWLIQRDHILYEAYSSPQQEVWK